MHHKRSCHRGEGCIYSVISHDTVDVALYHNCVAFANFSLLSLSRSQQMSVPLVQTQANVMLVANFFHVLNFNLQLGGWLSFLTSVTRLYSKSRNLELQIFCIVFNRDPLKKLRVQPKMQNTIG